MRIRRLALLFLWSALAAQAAVAWRNAMSQPEPWYAGDEARRIADNLLLYQFDNGGWEKNIDNGATYTQMRFLARVYNAGPDRRYADAFNRGLHYLLEAQYANGGWPQFYPRATDTGATSSTTTTP